MVSLPEAAKRAMQGGAEVSRFLYAHPEITARLPKATAWWSFSWTIPRPWAGPWAKGRRRKDL
ncbi:hypothetical protein [Thermus amyloliquefaciens]|uniref:hypothetical protein n=1 Tax=Thermus amyloliquefaciens TaxID=1449080 RepID=UPI000A961D27|nr:hypothetical protein [Thermus amyloliquefaciens]